MLQFERKKTPSESSSAQNLMLRDYQELTGLSSTSNPQLRFYQWERPSITYGYFIKPETHLNLKGMSELGWDIARRPTGGGVILHAYDLAFAVLIPAHHPAYSVNPLENYAWVNQRVAQAIQSLLGDTPGFYTKACDCKTLPTFCMAQPTQYDLMFEGKKVAGAAQRLTKQGFLHQGSICLTLPPQRVLDAVMLNDSAMAQEMQSNSYPLADRLSQDYDAVKQELMNLLGLILKP